MAIIVNKDGSESAKYSASDLLGFAECRRQWWLSQKWFSKTPPYALWYGRLVHAAMEDYYRQDRDPEVGDAAMQKEMEEIFTENPDMETSIQQELLAIQREASDVFFNYTIFDESEPIEGEVIEVEKYFRLPLTSNIFISGKIDVVMRSPSGGIIIVDHKTAGGLTSNIRGLDIDEQMTVYAWAIWKMFKVLPEKIIYNNVVKKVPDAPRHLKNGTLSKSKDQNTVFDLYRYEIDDLGLDVNDYTETLSWFKTLGWSKYFRRDVATRSEKEIKSFQRRAIEKIKDLYEIETDETRAYSNPSTYRCTFCRFMEVCKAMDKQEDWEDLANNTMYKWSDTWKAKKKLKKSRKVKKAPDPIVDIDPNDIPY